MRLIPRLPSQFNAVAEEFIAAKVKNAGAKGVVVGLSGGLDSAVVVALCARALGSRHVLAVYMPDKTTPKKDEHDCVTLTKELKVPLKIIHITHDVDALVNSVKEGGITPNKNAVLNLKARARASILYGIANTKNYLVAGTSNKSELLTGYFTKYGDGACDFSAIGDLYKTQVRILGELMGIPDPIMTKPPSAGLYKGQTDEEELGISYDILDQVLIGLDMALPHNKIVKYTQSPSRGCNARTVVRIEKMVKNSAHKRAGPKILKVGMKTVGVDRRETNN